MPSKTPFGGDEVYVRNPIFPVFYSHAIKLYKKKKKELSKHFTLRKKKNKIKKFSLPLNYSNPDKKKKPN